MVANKVISPWTWGDAFGFVPAVESVGAARIIHCAGQCDQSREDGTPLHPDDMTAQAAGALDNVEAVLKEAGLGLGAIVRINYYTTDVDAFMPAMKDIIVPRLDEAGCRASSTLLGVTRLAFPRMLIEIEVTAVA